MNKPHPFIHLYKHPTNETFVVLRWCMLFPSGSLSCSSWGALLHHTAHEIQGHGIEIILRAMDGFYSRKESDGSELHGNSPIAKRARRLLASHDLVEVRLIDGMELYLLPWHKRGGGHRSANREAEITVSTATPPDEFYMKLVKRFEECWTVYE
jgi:hypothetical protein